MHHLKTSALQKLLRAMPIFGCIFVTGALMIGPRPTHHLACIPILYALLLKRVPVHLSEVLVCAAGFSEPGDVVQGTLPASM